MARVSANRAFDCSDSRQHHSPNEGDITAAHFTCCQLMSKSMMSLVVFSRNQKTTCFFIQSMNDAGAPHPINPRETFSTMVKKGIDESSFWITRSRMDHHACSLINHNDILILKNNIKRKVLGNRGGFYKRRDDHFNVLTCFNLKGRALWVLLVNKNKIPSNKFLKTCTRKLRNL